MSCTGLLLFVAFFRWFREFLTKLAPSLISLNIGKYSVLICVCVCLSETVLVVFLSSSEPAADCVEGTERVAEVTDDNQHQRVVTAVDQANNQQLSNDIGKQFTILVYFLVNSATNY